MIVPGPATRIFLAPGPTDLRRSFVSTRQIHWRKPKRVKCAAAIS